MLGEWAKSIHFRNAYLQWSLHGFMVLFHDLDPSEEISFSSLLCSANRAVLLPTADAVDASWCSKCLLCVTCVLADWALFNMANGLALSHIGSNVRVDAKEIQALSLEERCFGKAAISAQPLASS